MTQLSEDELIAKLFSPIAGVGGLGLLDDAALVQPERGCDMVVTVDALVAGVHFFPDDPPASIARKALGVNLSDLAAKGATPTGFLLALALPSDWTTAWLDTFAQGLGDAARRSGCALLGGDTVKTPGPLTLSITAFGSVPAGRMVRRTGARPGDRLFVSGTIGDAALGLQLRLGEAARSAGIPSLDAAFRSDLLDRYLHPRPRLALIDALRHHANGAMDVSDGLVGDIAKMLKASGVSGRIDLSDVPLSGAARAYMNAEPDAFAKAVTGGDDYEILVSVPPAEAAAFAVAASEADIAVTAIGHVLAGNSAPLFHDRQGQVVLFERGSFSHF